MTDEAQAPAATAEEISESTAPEPPVEIVRDIEGLERRAYEDVEALLSDVETAGGKAYRIIKKLVESRGALVPGWPS